MVAVLFCRRSSWTRDRTCVSCIEKWILYHWTIWEAQALYYLLKSNFLLFSADGTLTSGWVCQPSSLSITVAPFLLHIYICDQFCPLTHGGIVADHLWKASVIFRKYGKESSNLLNLVRSSWAIWTSNSKHVASSETRRPRGWQDKKKEWLCLW